MQVGIPRETLPGETRVAATPETVKKLAQAGHRVLVERGAGTGDLLAIVGGDPLLARPKRNAVDIGAVAIDGVDGSERSGKAPTVGALLLSHASSLHRERLAEPHLTPPLARRVRHHRQRTSIGASVARFRPRIDVGQSVV